MPTAIWELILIAILIVANGCLVMMEIAIVKARRARLEVLLRAGAKSAKTALDLSSHPSRILSTLQIGVTLIGILTGALGGATLSDRLSAWYATFPMFAGYDAPLALATVVVGITFFSLLIGELIPKQIAFRHSERIAVAFASTMQTLFVATYPIVKILSFLSDSALKLTGLSKAGTSDVTEEEIKIMVEHGAKTGVFEHEEREMFEGALGLADTRIAALMTPRNTLDWLNLNDTEEALLDKIAESTHKRFPVARRDLDHIIGIVHTKEVYSKKQRGEPLDLTQLLHEPLYLPMSVSALEALRQFKFARTHIALVVNEHGTLQGMLTINDLVEAVLGDLPSSHIPDKLEIVKRADGSWLVDGLIPIEEFKENFGIETLPMENDVTFHTLGGFIVSYLGKIPAASDWFEWNGWKFEVVDMDRRRVDKVLVTELAPTVSATEAE